MIDLDSNIRAAMASLGMPWEGVVRLILAGGVSGLIGLERELRGRPAGLRTTMLLSIGSALAALVSISIAQRDWAHVTGLTITSDPARIAYGVMTGIGLLCAGVIIKTGEHISGMTTAAALWCATAIGLAAGIGLYLLTICAGLLILCILVVLQILEMRLPRIQYVWLTIRRKWDRECVAATIDYFRKMGLRVGEVQFDRSADGLSVDIRLNIGLHARNKFAELAEKIEVDPKMEVIAGSNL